MSRDTYIYVSFFAAFAFFCGVAWLVFVFSFDVSSCVFSLE